MQKTLTQAGLHQVMVSDFFIGFSWMSTNQGSSRPTDLWYQQKNWKEVIDRNLNEVWSSLGTVHHISSGNRVIT